MKTKPTDLDREAARLFTPAPGMRVFNAYTGWGRLAEAAWAGTTLAHWSTDSLAVAGHTRVDALDTDDPPTVGAMLAQVEQSRPGFAVSIIDRLATIPGEPDRRFAALVSNADGVQDVFTGPTRGAALVAAGRALVVTK